MQNAFKTSTHSLMCTHIGGSLVVSCFGLDANGEPDYDKEICHREFSDPKEAAECFRAVRDQIAPKVSQARAREIIAQAKAAAKEALGLDGFGWDMYLDRVMTPDERLGVKVYWETLPGHFNFINALTRLARGRK